LSWRSFFAIGLDARADATYVACDRGQVKPNRCGYALLSGKRAGLFRPLTSPRDSLQPTRSDVPGQQAVLPPVLEARQRASEKEGKGRSEACRGYIDDVLGADFTWPLLRGAKFLFRSVTVVAYRMLPAIPSCTHGRFRIVAMCVEAAAYRFRSRWGYTLGIIPNNTWVPTCPTYIYVPTWGRRGGWPRRISIPFSDLA
jgi:hypothetical protein